MLVHSSNFSRLVSVLAALAASPLTITASFSAADCSFSEKKPARSLVSSASKHPKRKKEISETQIIFLDFSEFSVYSAYSVVLLIFTAALLSLPLSLLVPGMQLLDIGVV